MKDACKNANARAGVAGVGVVPGEGGWSGSSAVSLHHPFPGAPTLPPQGL